jgi:putative addiction module CopG family antidote
VKVSLTPHQQKFIAQKLKSGGYASRSEIMREALRVYELFETEDYDAGLENELREGLRSPLKKYTRNHFAKLPKGVAKRAAA